MSFQPSDLGYDELDWWKARIDQEGRESVRQSCREIGLAQMQTFSRLNARSLRESLGKGPRTRNALLAKARDPKTRHALLICAHYRLECACRWIDTAGPFARDYLEGKANSKRVSGAASAAGQFLDDLPTYWPFEDGTDPFGEGLPLDADDEASAEG